MKHRMTIAVLSLAGFFVSLYLWLWKVGVLGTIACGDGGCETVQLSEYAEFLGLPVAFHGMVGYLVLMIVSLVGLQPRWTERREPTGLLVVFSGIGVLFAGYLTYLEAAVIHAWCWWCVVSAVMITTTFAAGIAGLMSKPRTPNT
ncbi:MAG: vitamin K epoxide reductase family protein [Gemmatimonadota bacterium]